METCGTKEGAGERGFAWLLRALFAAYAAGVYVLAYRPHSPFGFMLPNALLAYIPVELSFHLRPGRRAAVFWPLFAAWFFFYPNAPYVLTDFFHLAKIDPYRAGSRALMRPDARLWLDFTTVAFGAVLCPLAGTWCLRRTLAALLARFGRGGAQWRGAAAGVVMVAASFGMYLGRFPRLHTVHLLTAPLSVAEGALTVESGVGMAAFVVLMTILQGLTWVLTAGGAGGGGRDEARR